MFLNSQSGGGSHIIPHLLNLRPGVALWSGQEENLCSWWESTVILYSSYLVIITTVTELSWCPSICRVWKPFCFTYCNQEVMFFVLYFMTLSLSQDVQCWWQDRLWTANWKAAAAAASNQSTHITFFWRGWGKWWKTSVRVVMFQPRFELDTPKI